MPDSSPNPRPHLVPQDLRIDYTRGRLDEADVARDPVEQFERWLADAQAAGIKEFNAMTLATADRTGMPSARIVLLKAFDSGGFCFFTNYNSRKSRELEANPRAALVFYWQPLERQVRIEGTAQRVTRAESEIYFITRPRDAQIGAWVSQQSELLESRARLEQIEGELRARFGDGPVPLPDFWGGYRVVPQVIEFWQGRASRLHDRLRYSRTPDGAWVIQRLAP